MSHGTMHSLIHSLIHFATEIDMSSRFYIFSRQLTPEFVTTRYPDAAYGTPYELYDEDIVNEILNNSEGVLKWIESQIEM